MSTYKRKTSNGQGANICALLSALMWGNKTRKELMEITGVCPDVLRNNLKVLKDGGLVYKHSFTKDNTLREDGTYKSGYASVVYAFNNPPFSHEDFH